MGKRFVVAALGAALVGSALIGVGAAGASKPPVTAFGVAQCTLGGKVTYNPPLTATTKSTTATMSAKLACSVGQTGGGLTVTSGKLIATSTSVGMSCSARNIAEVDATLIWKAKGGGIVPTTANLGAGATASSFTFTTQAIASGSYVALPLEIRGAFGPGSCAKKRGIKKLNVGGTVDIGTQCDSNILTGNGVTTDAEEHLWYVVASFCDYTPATHPTGTISYHWDNGPAALCSAPPTAIVDSGQTGAFVPWTPGAVFKPYTYWGIDTGLTVPETGTTCSGKLHVTYSGDSRYRPHSIG